MVGRCTVCAVVAMLLCLPQAARSQAYPQYYQASYAPPAAGPSPAPGPVAPQGGPNIANMQPNPEFYGYSSNIPPCDDRQHPFETAYYHMEQSECAQVLENAFTEAW